MIGTDVRSCTAAVREAALPDGRRLVVRPVRVDDVEGLEALYDALDEESRYRRFFSVYHPRRSFFERLVTVERRGGEGLVVMVEDDVAKGHIIAEASYELLENGNGEVAITVDRAWRGWLGPYLLDALVEVAARRGVPELEAEILATNGPMLALFRSRGCVRLPRQDRTVLRERMSTAARPMS